MAWHLEAVGSNGQRGTGDQDDDAHAAYLYKKVVDTWNAEEFEVRVPAHRRGRLADDLQDQVRDGGLALLPAELGEVRPAFDSVVEENPKAPEAAEPRTRRCSATRTSTRDPPRRAADKKGSATSPARRVRSEGQKEDEESAALKPKEFTESQKGMVSAFNRYICYIRPAAGQRRAGAARRGQGTPARAPTSRRSTGTRPRSPSVTSR